MKFVDFTALLICLTTTLPAHAQEVIPKDVGDAFSKPFRATTKTRQRCIHGDILGCGPDPTEPSEPEGTRRHLLVEDDDGDLWMDFDVEESVSIKDMTTVEYNPISFVCSPGEPCPAHSPQEPPPPIPTSPDKWTYRGEVVLNGIAYKNYTTDFYAVANFENEDMEQSKLFIESGMVPNFFEYLEVASDGTPFRMREYSTTARKLYRETVFQSVEPLNNQEINEMQKAEAQEHARKLQAKLQSKRHTIQVATTKSNFQSLTSPLRGVNRRRALAFGGSITMPAGCDQKEDSFFCFALQSMYDLPKKELTTDLAIWLGGKKAAGKMSKGGSVSILGQIVVGDGGELKKISAAAKGCVEIARDVGLGAVGVEICAQGALRMIPKESLEGKIEFWTAAFFEVFGVRLSVKIIGGELEAHADYIDNMYRIKDIAGFAWQRFNFYPVYVGMGVAVKARPHGTFAFSRPRA